MPLDNEFFYVETNALIILECPELCFTHLAQY